MCAMRYTHRGACALHSMLELDVEPLAAGIGSGCKVVLFFLSQTVSSRSKLETRGSPWEYQPPNLCPPTAGPSLSQVRSESLVWLDRGREGDRKVHPEVALSSSASTMAFSSSCICSAVSLSLASCALGFKQTLALPQGRRRHASRRTPLLTSETD
jgi:hypothetical protein